MTRQKLVLKTLILFCIQALFEAMERVKTSLETEQEKLATLVKNLSVDPSQTEEVEKGEEPAVSEEWLQSLKERRKVRVMIDGWEELLK